MNQNMVFLKRNNYRQIEFLAIKRYISRNRIFNKKEMRNYSREEVTVRLREENR